MNQVRFNVRNVQDGMSEDGLTCESLYIDQIHIIFVPMNDPVLVDKFRDGDSDQLRWRAEMQVVNIRLNPGERYSLQTRDPVVTDTAPAVAHMYSASLTQTPYTGAPEEDYWCRTYRPIRDLPAAQNLNRVSDLEVELLWPLLQGDPSVVWWKIPDYRIFHVLVDFSYH